MGTTISADMVRNLQMLMDVDKYVSFDNILGIRIGDSRAYVLDRFNAFQIHFKVDEYGTFCGLSNIKIGVLPMTVYVYFEEGNVSSVILKVDTGTWEKSKYYFDEYARILHSQFQKNKEINRYMGIYPSKEWIFKNTIIELMNIYLNEHNFLQIQLKGREQKNFLSIISKPIITKLLNYLLAFILLALGYLFVSSYRYSYREQGLLRIDKWTGNIEVYKSNGIWEPY